LPKHLIINFFLNLKVMQFQKIGYTLLLLISAAISLQAQKFVSLENRWRLFYIYRGEPYAHITSFKDSIEINGKYYYQAYDSIVNALTPTRDYYREEAGIVYYLRDNGSTDIPKEQVIYNFNMVVGDSITYDRNFRLKVLKIDSTTLLDGSKRKRWELSMPRYPYSLYWTEGIGANIEPLRPHFIRLIGLVEGLNNLSCYFYKNQLLYSNPYDEGNNGGLSCSPKLADPVSTRNLQELNSLEVLQNRGDGEVIFQLNESGRYQCHLYSATGAVLEQKVLGQGVHRISLLAFPKGMYFLRVLDTELWQQKTLKLVR